LANGYRRRLIKQLLRQASRWTIRQISAIPPRALLAFGVIATVLLIYGWAIINAPAIVNQAALNSTGLSPGERLTAEHNARLLVVSLGGALAVGAGLLYTARNYRLARRGQVTERFTKALERLGSNELYVRIGGVHALEHVMRDSPDHHGDVVEVLVAFVRDRAPALTSRFEPKSQWVNLPIASDLPNLPDVPSHDVAAALAAIGSRPKRPARERAPLNFRDIHLRGLNLNRADFEDADFTRADLQNASLPNANLSRCNLSYADLRNSNLSYAILDGANLSYARLKEVNLLSARLSDAVLTGAYIDSSYLKELSHQGAHLWNVHAEREYFWRLNLKGAELWGIHLEGASLFDAHFEGADLSGAHFVGATLMGAHFEGADLSDADLRDAKLLGTHLEGAFLQGAFVDLKQLEHAILDDNTYLPDDIRAIPRRQEKESLNSLGESLPFNPGEDDLSGS